MTSKNVAVESATLINYIELWTLQRESLALECAIALDPQSARTIDTNGRTLGKGEGLAGSAWQQENPVIMQGASAFIDEASTSSGLPIKAMIAIPVYRDFTLLNVLVLGLSPGNGGLEIWTRDDRDELSISGSYYEGLKAFEFISQYVRFPKGAGLPGSSWKTGRPRMIDGPDKDPDFIRSFDRDKSTPTQCIGLPISRQYGFPASILLMLSDEGQPLAKLTEILHCNPKQTEAGEHLKLVDTHSGTARPWMQPIIESMSHHGSAMVFAEGELVPPGYRCGLAMPFFADERIEDVFVMLL
jgi:hypothetical protein